VVIGTFTGTFSALEIVYRYIYRYVIIITHDVIQQWIKYTGVMSRRHDYHEPR